MFYLRKSPRLKYYDYSVCNYYFITICTHGKECIFGFPNQLNAWGKIALEHLSRIEQNYACAKVIKAVIMPNHVHMVLALDDSKNNPNVSTLIGLYKTGVTKQIRMENPDAVVWQRSFHDHIIRNQISFERIWNYIENNPAKWEEDCFYIRQAENNC